MNDTQPSSPIDRNGAWFNPLYAELTEKMYRQHFKTSRVDRIPPSETERDPALASMFHRQDRARMALKAAVVAAGERLPNGDPTSEMVAFLACCREQAAENLGYFQKRNRRGLSGGTRTEQLAAMQRSHGLSAKPRHEDPAELRRAALELGLISE